MIGQVATFMGELRLSYSEVYEKVPYRNLVLMQKDKLHSTYGDTVTHATSAELFGNKIK